MKRVISLYLPNWPTDRARRQMGNAAPSPETPLALLGREGNKRIVTAMDQAAQRLGITKGMAATQARALFKGLHVEEADAKADAKALVQLAEWVMTRYSPVAATDSPDGLLIDATGAAHLFGGEQGMLADLTDKLKAAGYIARAAMAPTYEAAYAFARTARTEITLVSDAQCEALLCKLPVSALRLPASTISGLSKLGFETIGELKAKPRAPLALRFGPEVGRRLDQALGCAAEAISPVIPPDLITIKRAFAEPISNPETIARYIGLLTETLCRKLEAKVAGARCLDLFFHRVDSHSQSVRIGLASPRRDAKRLTRLMCDKLETIDPGFGIELMSLSAPWIEPLVYKQSTMGMGEKQQADIASLIDTLSNRLGPEHVYQLVSVESDVPERSVAKVLPLCSLPQANWPARWPRPVRLFPRPEPIETIAMLPDNAPVSFVWRGVRHRVQCADGPERIFGEWWRRDVEMEAVRDYFQLEDEAGERFWVFRAGDGMQLSTGSHRWFMHGVFG